LDAAIERYLKGTNDHTGIYGIGAARSDATRGSSAQGGIASGFLKNRIRSASADGVGSAFVQWLDDGEKKKLAIAALDEIVRQIQERYAAVIREQTLLKQRLLSEMKL
jgi:hypothetical protein